MVKVTDRYYINANSNCYTLLEKTTVQDEQSNNYGKEIYKDSGYYTTLEQCLKGMLKANIREFIAEEKEKSIQSLLKELKKQTEMIESLKLDI